MRAFVTATATVLAAAVLAGSASAAAPRYIIVSGHGLAAPVLLDDWNENLMLLVSLVRAKRVPVPPAAARRTSFDLAMFWGVPAKPVPTRASEASQHGRFYPATSTAPAVFDLQLNGARYARLATPQALHILHRHGVPVRLPRR